MPSPLEMYSNSLVGLLKDEIPELNLQLRKAWENIRGLEQMNDELSAGKTRTDDDLKKAPENISQLNYGISSQYS